MRMTESQLRKTIRKTLVEATNSRSIRDEIEAELDALEAEDEGRFEAGDYASAAEAHRDDLEDMAQIAYGNEEYTLDDIVNTQVLNTKSAAGAKAWIDGTLDQIKRYLVDDEFAETVMDIRDSNYIFQEFQDARDKAIKFWSKIATVQTGSDVSTLPEFSDQQFMNEFLFDFWMLATFVKPIIRQMDKGKTASEASTSAMQRWKYMTEPNRIKDFIKNVITPSFTFLTRDTSIMG